MARSDTIEIEVERAITPGVEVGSSIGGVRYDDVLALGKIELGELE